MRNLTFVLGSSGNIACLQKSANQQIEAQNRIIEEQNGIISGSVSSRVLRVAGETGWTQKLKSKRYLPN